MDRTRSGTASRSVGAGSGSATKRLGVKPLHLSGNLIEREDSSSCSLPLRGQQIAALDVAREVISAANADLQPRISSDEPEAQARDLRKLRAGLPVTHGAFYRALKLTPEQIARFESGRVDHEGRMRDIRATARGLKIDPATVELRDTATIDGRRVRVQIDGAIAALQRKEEAAVGAVGGFGRPG